MGAPQGTRICKSDKPPPKSSPQNCNSKPRGENNFSITSSMPNLESILTEQSVEILSTALFNFSVRQK